MACGFGACYGCAVRIDGVWKRLCVEGPVRGGGACPRLTCAPSSAGSPLANPLVNGSGTLDALAAGTLGLGAFVTKTVTLHPREGNPPPRIAETPAGHGQLDRACEPGPRARSAPTTCRAWASWACR